MKIFLFSLFFALTLPTIAVEWSDTIPENELTYNIETYPPPEDHDIKDETSFNEEQLKDYYLKLSEEAEMRIYYDDKNHHNIKMNFDELAIKKPEWILLVKNDFAKARFKLRGEHYHLSVSKSSSEGIVRVWIPFNEEQLEDYCLNLPVLKVKTHIYFLDKAFKQLNMQLDELATRKPEWILMRKDTAPAAAFKLSGDHYKFIDTKMTALLKAYLLNFGTEKVKNYNFSSDDYQFLYFFINDANEGSRYPHQVIEKNELRHIIYYNKRSEEDITCVCYRFLPQYRALVKVPIPKAAMVCFENELSLQRRMFDVVKKMSEGIKERKRKLREKGIIISG